MDINSTMIKSVEYDKATKAFKVQFHSGKTYEYKDVSPAKFNKFMGAESKGKFLNAKIKPKHEFSQLEKEAFWSGFLDEVKNAEYGVTPAIAKRRVSNAAIGYLLGFEEPPKKEASLMVHGLSHMLAMHPRRSSSRNKTAMIVEEEGDFVLYTKDGSKILGRHPTREKALAQERAIEISKAK